MPGRGQYWKKGGLIDETVKEEDLSQALQTKVNAVGGGGGSEVIGSDDVSTPQTTMTATISPTVAMGSSQEIIAVAWFDLAVSGTVKCQVSGETGSNYRVAGHGQSNAESSNWGAGGTDGWSTGDSYLAGKTHYLRYQISGQQFGGAGPNVIMHSVDGNQTVGFARWGGGGINTSLSNFSEIKLTASQNFTAGSSLRVYKVNRS